jgi:predicted permease
MRRFLFRLANLFLPRRAEREMGREMESHLALMAEEFERRGLSPSEAARTARLAYGGVDQARELHRDARSFVWIEQLVKDLRYASRNLRRSPGFTLVAAAVLALGIGANASIFAVYNAIALKPLPVADPGRVVRLKRWFARRTIGDVQYNFAYPEYQYLREHAVAISALVAASESFPVTARLAERELPNPLTGHAVSTNYFADLGIPPWLGRMFLPDEERSVVLSYSFWQREFRGDTKAIGQTIELNRAVYTIIGVAPRDFTGTAVFPAQADFWAPLPAIEQLDPTYGPGWRDWRDSTSPGFQLLARVKNGYWRSQARAEMDWLVREFLAGRREPDRTTAITLERTSYLGTAGDINGFRASAAALWTAVSLILLVACANVANMSLARGAARRREIALRLAIGARRGRVVRQLLIEAILVAVLGGLGAVLAAGWAGHMLWAALSGILQGFRIHLFELDPAPDWRLFAYGLAISVATGILFGLAPALRLTRVDLHAAMKDQNPMSLGPAGRSGLRGVFLATQVAVSVLLLMTSGILLTAQSDSANEPGFDTRNTYLLLNYNEPGDSKTNTRRIRERLMRVPELSGVAIGDVPLMGNGLSVPMTVGPSVRETLVSYESDGYFEAMGIRILRGRGFTRVEADSLAPVAIVSDATARFFWPGLDPLGKRFTLSGAYQKKLIEFEVVGVAKDIRYEVITELDPGHVYLPTDSGEGRLFGGLVFRIRGDRGRALQAVRAALQSANPKSAPALAMVSMEDGPVAIQRKFMAALARFSSVLTFIALMLAAAGVYGVVAFLVSLRKRELGIRIALGASARQVLSIVIGDALRPVLVGMLIGFPLAGGLSILLDSSQSFRESLFLDPVAYGFLAVVLVIALAAGAAPAQRALRIDPAMSLRDE